MPDQRDLSVNINSLLLKERLKREITVDMISDMFVKAVANRRNHISRESLKYHMSLDTFIKQITDELLKDF
ncbi:hypothetical protein [Lactiplantibacillus plantarum]|uniref:hypothetical protein n=1 Tax=Lactiplantibacillus plantarum TaxID=1590 RepID=UPI0029429BAF|nr:hypothetical protein [Lactiplantibacillus plantarum]WOI05862.1 hypothetical protein RI097_15585 [Lactiplantibacillus plantarum]